METDFNKEDTRENKLALLQSVSKEHTDYEKSKDMIKGNKTKNINSVNIRYAESI